MSNLTASHPALDDPNAFVLYRYHPSLAAAIVFIIAFCLTTLAHCFLAIRQGTWYFIPFIIGGICEIIGYTGRALSSHDQWALGPYIMQSILLLAAPPLFSASIYMILGRVILLLRAESLAIVRPARLTKFFVVGDVISLVCQCGGGGMMAINQQMLHIGEKVVIAGLFVQLIFFGFFIFVGGRFHFLVVKTGKDRQRALPWRNHMFNLYTASVLILVRSLFRVIEYIQGNNGFLLRNETFLYVFDALLMFFVMVLFIFIHPSEVTRCLKEQEAHGASILALS